MMRLINQYPDFCIYSSDRKLNKKKQKTLSWLPRRQSINWWWKVKEHIRHPKQNLTQAWRASKSLCLVYIRPTEKFQSHPRKSFRINKCWSSQLKTHRSKTNKGIIGRWIWRRFLYQSKKIDLFQQEFAPNWHPCHDLPKYWGVRKYTCTICICTTENLQSHPCKSISINEFWSDQRKKNK